jgi:hypothetical protein
MRRTMTVHCIWHTDFDSIMWLKWFARKWWFLFSTILLSSCQRNSWVVIWTLFPAMASKPKIVQRQTLFGWFDVEFIAFFRMPRIRSCISRAPLTAMQKADSQSGARLTASPYKAAAGTLEFLNPDASICNIANVKSGTRINKSTCTISAPAADGTNGIIFWYVLPAMASKPKIV